MAYPIIFTAKAFIAKLIHIGQDVPSGYYNKYPHNLGYWDGKRFTWDCFNLIKSLFWGWVEKKIVGYHAKYNASTGVKDWTGRQILDDYCYDVSKDFSNLTPGEYLLGTDDDHGGTYIGNMIINGHCYNVVECTTAWDGGVIFTYVSNTGGRYKYKGGAKASVSWMMHGKMYGIDYTVQPEPPTPPVPPEPEENIYYTVVRGDNLTKIANKYKTTVSQLVAWNNIKNPNLIYVGQVLIVGKKSPYPPQPQPVEEYYVVQKGDNLTRIAQKYGTTVGQLVEWNHIQNPNLIYPGQVLRVK